MMCVNCARQSRFNKLHDLLWTEDTTGNTKLIGAIKEDYEQKNLYNNISRSLWKQVHRLLVLFSLRMSLSHQRQTLSAKFCSYFISLRKIVVQIGKFLERFRLWLYQSH